MNFSRPMIVLALALAGCSATPATPLPPLAGAKIGAPFSLIDQDGKTVTDKTFAGKYRIMYFGYTFCPDVCPTTAQTIGAAMRALDKSDPALSAKVVPVFVTVDPLRDTPKVVGQFARAFYPRFVGLTGSKEATGKAATDYGVFFGGGPMTGKGAGYLVQHSNAVYLMDPDNKPITTLPTEKGVGATAEEIKRWVK